ncbi:hypothetical protein CBM2609_A170112 [Cupriavidus taiwanensis]|nr:hypothetical protein CBM2604_A140115 [Cupriavidus taiwanensis]SOZ25862.1 hypothetical protein CBM2609_A170112 [Cupriavidus taiwanensis]SOZ45058.1 hypothetical protein CBM2610_A160111 [Cupriavidus taiwanensis]
MYVLRCIDTYAWLRAPNTLTRMHNLIKRPLQVLLVDVI